MAEEKIIVPVNRPPQAVFQGQHCFFHQPLSFKKDAYPCASLDSATLHLSLSTALPLLKEPQSQPPTCSTARNADSNDSYGTGFPSGYASSAALSLSAPGSPCRASHCPPPPNKKKKQNTRIRELRAALPTAAACTHLVPDAVAYWRSLPRRLHSGRHKLQQLFLH